MLKLRPPVDWFANRMEFILRKHDKTKPGWIDCSFDYLLDRLSEECFELEDAIKRNEDVVSEAVDVANFAMMIAYNHHRKQGRGDYGEDTAIGGTGETIDGRP